MNSIFPANPIYLLMESPHRWSILAGLSFGIGVIGAMASLAYAWPHWFGRAWFYLFAAGTIAFLVLAFLDWRARVEAALKQAEDDSSRTHGDVRPG